MENIVCSQVTKTYGKKNAVDHIDLTIEKGKIYGMIGRNGAGKTTLLSMMAKQIAPTFGKVTWNGQDIWENKEALNHICFAREIAVGSSNNGLATLKAKDYLQAASFFYPNWDKEFASELIKKFELDIKQKLGKMSKGMLSMVTIIIALASKADFTFMDEPVAGLDVVAREDFYRILLNEYMESGRTFIVSTHIIEEASDIFEEVIMINRGKVLAKENTQELLERTYQVNGLAETVDKAVEGLKCYHAEKIGRSKSVVVVLEPGQSLRKDPELTITPVKLQHLFVAMCGMEN